MTRNIETFRTDWNGITLEIRWEPNWLNIDTGIDPAHLEIESIHTEGYFVSNLYLSLERSSSWSVGKPPEEPSLIRGAKKEGSEKNKCLRTRQNQMRS